MNEKFKWIFLYGGLGWGISFACLTFAFRYIQDKPQASSLPIFLAICIVAGMIWGWIMFKSPVNRKA